MPEIIFTTTAIAGLVLLAYAIEKLSETFTDDYEERKQRNDLIDSFSN